MHQMTVKIGLVALLALGGVAVAKAGNGADPGLACGVSSVTERGMTTFEAVLQSPTPSDGAYRFALKSSGGGGSSTINQGGGFSTLAGEPVSLAKVMLNAGASIDVDFSVTIAGRSFDCSQLFTPRT